MIYIAVIGEIRDAAALADRRETMERLRAACARLNQWREPLGLAALFTLTVSDEFQALLTHARGIWHSVFAIEAALQPVRLRFGIGVGAVESKIDPAAAVGLDGPALHRAREALDALRADGGSYRVLGLDRAEALARHALDLVSHERGRWNANRVDIFSMLLNGKSAAHMANALGISEQAVYKSIRQGRLETVQGVCRAVGGLLDAALRAGNDPDGADALNARSA